MLSGACVRPTGWCFQVSVLDLLCGCVKVPVLDLLCGCVKVSVLDQLRGCVCVCRIPIIVCLHNDTLQRPYLGKLSKRDY